MKRTLIVFATCMTTLYLYGLSLQSYDGRGGLSGYYQQLEANMENPKEASGIVNLMVQIECCNLAAEGEKDALEWARKYLERYPPAKGGGYWVLYYLTTKGDERDIETVSRYSDDAHVQLLKMRVAGMNVFDIDCGSPYHLGYPEFLPSVNNMGPQAVYVREILNRYWEEVGMDSSKIPQELLTMVVSFDKDGNPVCNVDLAKYGLSVPVITPKPDKYRFESRGWTENESWAKMTVTFPDLAEPVEITPYMNRKAPDWKGLYVHAKKKTVLTSKEETVSPSSPLNGETPTERSGKSPNNKTFLWLFVIVSLAVIGGVAMWRKVKQK